MDYVANFDALDARLNAAGDALANAIVTVKHGTKKHPWQIDAISGATVSSKAEGKALNEASQYLLPRLLPHIGQIQQIDPLPEQPVAEPGESVKEAQ